MLPYGRMEEPLLISSASNRCPSRFFTCNICFTELPLERKFKGCRHPYCTNCVAKYIEAQVIYRNISKITCPEFNCNVMLEASSYQSVLPKSVFEKWCRALCESAVFLNASKGGVAYGRSYCPYRNCSELVLNECVGYSSSSKITESNCPSCKKPFCFHCMVPWKENHQCNSNREIVIDIDSKDDSLFMKIVKKKRWRRCPSCKHYVERNEGCKMITCRCETVFCHECGSIRFSSIRRPCKPTLAWEMIFLFVLVCALFLFTLFMCGIMIYIMLRETGLIPYDHMITQGIHG